MSTVKDLKDYKDKLYSSLTRELEAFEKNFILISSGLLAFSVTFIKDIVKTDEATLLFFLFAGWLLMIAAVGVMMWAFLRSAKISRQLSNHVDEFLAHRNKFESTDTLDANDMRDYKLSQSTLFKRGVSQLEKIRDYAVWLLIIGLLFFSFFVGYNIMQEKARKQKDKSTCCIHSPCPANDAKIMGNKNNTSLKINYNICKDEISGHSQCRCYKEGQGDPE